jgi:hypothetical protein
VRGGRGRVLGIGVDADGGPGENTVRNVVAEVDVVQDGVAGGRLLGHDAVGAVEGEGLRVGAVRRDLVDGVVERLVKEQLADLGNGAARDGTVSDLGGSNVRQDVDVDRATGVVAGHDGVKLHNAVRVAELDATQSRVVQVAAIVGVAVSAGGHTAIDAGAVAVPGLQVHILQRLAGLGVDEEQLESQGNAGRAVGDVLADQLAGDICGGDSCEIQALCCMSALIGEVLLTVGTLGHLGLQDAGGV